MAKTINTSQPKERLLARREFLITAGGIILSLGPLSLVGCGGAGGFGGGGGMVQIGGTVVLPAGFGIPVTQLSLIAGLAATPLKAPNTFSAKISRHSPSLATLQDSAGNGILMAFLDPTKSNNVIDHNSTAVALLYFMLGSYTLPSSSTANILQLLSTDPSVAALARVIASRLAADPLAIVNGDSQIVAALQTAYDSIVPSSHSSVRHDTSGVGQPLASSAASLLVQPTGVVSGLEVVELTSALEVQVTNHFRRRCKVFVYKTGTQPSGGALTTFPRVASFAGPIDLPATQSLSIITALVDLFTGAAPFNPVSTPPIKFALDQGATKTLYEVVVVGSAGDDTDPTFYHDPRYIDQIPLFRSTRISLNLQSVFIDLVFSIFLEMLGVKQIVANADSVEQAASAVAAIQDAEWQAAIALGASGHYGEAVQNALTRIAISSLVRQDLVKALAPLLSAAEAAAMQVVEDGAVAAAYLAAKKFLQTILGATTAALALGDIGAVFKDLASADPGDLWTAVAFLPSFALNPPTATISAGQRVTFKITPPIGVIDSDVEYHWTETSTLGTLSSSDGLVGNAIITVGSAVTVDLVTTGGDQGTITVKVVAFEKHPDGSKTQLDQATAKVTIGLGTPTGVVQFIKYDPVKGDGFFDLFTFATFPIVPNATLYHIVYAGGVSGGFLHATDIAGGAPVVDRTPNHDLSTLVSYKQANTGGEGTPFFNMGGGMIGYLVFGFDGYNFISQYQATLDSENAALVQFDIKVVVT